MIQVEQKFCISAQRGTSNNTDTAIDERKCIKAVEIRIFRKNQVDLIRKGRRFR